MTESHFIPTAIFEKLHTILLHKEHKPVSQRSHAGISIYVTTTTDYAADGFYVTVDIDGYSQTVAYFEKMPAAMVYFNERLENPIPDVLTLTPPDTTNN